MRRTISILSTLLLAAGTASHGARIPIDACGATVGTGDVGVLAADLVCPPDVTGVTLAAGAKLLLGGHSITGGYHGVHVTDGVTRRASAVRGPGALQGAARCGVATTHPIELRDVTLQGNGECGILNAENDSMKLRAVTIAGNAGDGIWLSLLSAGLGDGNVKANGLEIVGNTGVAAYFSTPGKYALKNFLIRDNGGGLVVLGPKVGTLSRGEILTHSCDLVTSTPPLERGLVRIGTRCAP